MVINTEWGAFACDKMKPVRAAPAPALPHDPLSNRQQQGPRNTASAGQRPSRRAGSEYSRTPRVPRY